MQCYTELTPTTAVTHSLSLPFLSSSANNLIIAKTSLLQIYSFKTIVSNVSHDHVRNVVQNSTHYNHPAQSFISSSEVMPVRGERLHTTKLVLVAEYNLSGTVTSIARVKILRSKSGGEAILVSLKDAKLSLVEWDPERYSISTISIHYYEREDLQGSPWEPDLSQVLSHLCVDPRSRCAALKFGARHLAILPFHQAGDELVMDDYEPDIDEPPSASIASVRRASTASAGAEKTPYAASFVLSLLALDPSLSHPLHLAFLHEYREPTFGIISSQVAVSTALLPERRDTVSYTVFTLDLEQRASTTLLSVNNLPYDLFAVQSLPLPVGGALLIGANELIHVDQSGKANGVAVNEFAKQCTAFALLDQSELGMRLEHCIIEQLGIDNPELLMILNTGELAIISFKTDGRSVSGLSVRRLSEANGGLGIHVMASCASLIGRGRIFIGSEIADSVIMGWSRKSDKSKRQRTRNKMDIDEVDEALNFEEDEDDDDEDDDDLYSGVEPENGASNRAILSSGAASSDEYSFRIHDSLRNMGSMKDVAFRNEPCSSIENANLSKGVFSSLEVAVSTGGGKAGGLTLFQREMTPTTVDKYRVPNANGVWALYAQRNSEDSSGLAGKTESAVAQEHDRYIITSSVSKTGEEISNAYSVGSTGIDEINGTDFDPKAGATVEVGTLNEGTRIVQVLSAELRTFDGGKFGIFIVFDFVISFPLRAGSEASCRRISSSIRYCGSVNFVWNSWESLFGDHNLSCWLRDIAFKCTSFCLLWCAIASMKYYLLTLKSLPMCISAIP
jgi:cleavage and polyadenylation specificity factor subunit 1